MDRCCLGCGAGDRRRIACIPAHCRSKSANRQLRRDAGRVESLLPPPDHRVNEINVILITLDTLRTDRISSYGSTTVDTPNIDSFAEEGIRFTNAASTVPFTLPAHSSIMTGLYPPGHGVRENVGYVLDERHPTLAEMLGSRGWATAGFVSSFVLDRRWGIARGFDHFFDEFDLKEFDTASLGTRAEGRRRNRHRRRRLARHAASGPAVFHVAPPLRSPRAVHAGGAVQVKVPGRPYDAEVAYTDSLVGKMRRALDDRGLLDDWLASSRPTTVRGSVTTVMPTATTSTTPPSTWR